MPGETATRTPAYWLDRAEEARTRSEGLHDPVAVQSLRQIAQFYVNMARRAAEREAKQNPRSS